MSPLRNRTAAALPIALTLVMMVAAIIAAGFLGSFSADPVLRTGISSPPPEATPTPMASVTGEPPTSDTERIEIDGGTVVAIVLVLVTGALALLVRYLSRFRLGQFDRDRVLEHGDVGGELPHRPTEQGLSAWSEAAQAALDGDTDTSDAIIRCWLDLERHCASAGMPRRSTQTASDFASAVSGALALPPGPLTELTDLYQRARFARAPGGAETLRESDRMRAKDALEELSAALRDGRRQAVRP